MKAKDQKALATSKSAPAGNLPALFAPDAQASRRFIELAHRIRKRQFKFGPGRWICWSLKKQWDRALA